MKLIAWVSASILPPATWCFTLSSADEKLVILLHAPVHHPLPLSSGFLFFSTYTHCKNQKCRCKYCKHQIMELDSILIGVSVYITCLIVLRCEKRDLGNGRTRQSQEKQRSETSEELFWGSGALLPLRGPADREHLELIGWDSESFGHRSIEDGHCNPWQPHYLAASDR